SSTRFSPSASSTTYAASPRFLPPGPKPPSTLKRSSDGDTPSPPLLPAAGTTVRGACRVVAAISATTPVTRSTPVGPKKDRRPTGLGGSPPSNAPATTAV